MSPSKTRVSIGMPVYNGANYLRLALDSLRQQTYEEFEIVISDNASTDETESICRSYADQDSRIRYYRQDENIGAVVNFNRVFELSHGDYFKWAAHDDVCAPTFLERCVEILDQNPDVAWCHTKSDMIDSNGDSWVHQLPDDAEELEQLADGNRWWRGFPRQFFDSDCPARRYAGVLLGTNWCVDSYGLIRRDALMKTRLLEPLYGAEKVLMGELAIQGKYAASPEMLFAQRIHSAASSSLDSEAAQNAYVLHQTKKPFFSTRFALLKSHLAAVRHAELSWLNRMKCYFVVLRYIMQMNKWGRVMRSMLLRKGAGGGGRRMLNARKKQQAKSWATNQ